MPSTIDRLCPFVVAVLLLAGCNCGSRTLADTSDGDSSSGSSGSTTSDVPPDLPPDLPPVCEDPMLLCDGECIDPQFDSKHCGECGHACNKPTEQSQIGRCWGASCRPTYHACITAQDGFVTCEEYCVSVGQTCPPEDSVCGEGVRMWGAEQSEQCEAFEDGIFVGGAIDCTSPIPFGEFEMPDGGGTATYARCCCTQD